ncbi:MAG: hypothetical protein AAGA77_05335 [Bacteroidota bacterium]
MKNKNSKIENSFREKFEPGSIRNEGWNEPSDLVWENIEKEIYKEDRRKFGFLPFILTSCLLMSLIFTTYLYQQNKKLRDDLQKVDNTEEILIAPIGKTDAKKTAIASGEAVKLLNKPLQSKNVNAKKIGLKPSTIEYSDEKIRNNNSPINENLEQRKAKLKHESTNLKPFLNNSGENHFESNTEKSNVDAIPLNQEMMSTESELNQNREFVTFPNLITKLNEIKSESTHAILLKQVFVENKNFARNSRISFAPVMAMGVLKTAGNQEAVLTELIDEEYGNLGMGIDALVTLPLSNSVDFSFGLGVESMNFSTEYDITLPYNTEDETLMGESAFIDFEHSLPTAFGNTETTVTLNRKRASDALTEPNVVLDFDTRHRFVSLSLPMRLSYIFGSNLSFFSIGLAVRPTYIVQASSSIQYVFSHHSAIDAINNTSVSTYSDISRINASVGINLGYHLSLNKSSGIDINLGYENYLMDFYEVDNFSSTVQRIGISAGYSYKF